MPTATKLPEEAKAPERTWAVWGFVAAMALWAWFLGYSRLLMDTNLGLVWGLMGSGMVSLPAFGLAIVSPRRWPLTAFAAASIAAVVLCAVPWHPRKRFLNDLFDLTDSREEPPTIAQARERMARWSEIPCGLATRGPERPICYGWNLHDPDDAFEVGEVWTKNGEVIRVRFRDP